MTGIQGIKYGLINIGKRQFDARVGQQFTDNVVGENEQVDTVSGVNAVSSIGDEVVDLIASVDLVIMFSERSVPCALRFASPLAMAGAMRSRTTGPTAVDQVHVVGENEQVDTVSGVNAVSSIGDEVVDLIARR
jgi:hypothetical protein